MIHNNGAFPAIKGNPTTNYCITQEDEVRERIHFMKAVHDGEDWPPHEAYIGGRSAFTQNSGGAMKELAKQYLNTLYGKMAPRNGDSSKEPVGKRGYVPAFWLWDYLIKR